MDPLPQSTLDRKALFGFVTDPDLDPGLTADERAACTRSVPWTRLLGDRRTTDEDGRDVDLLEHVRAARGRLILKPNHDYGGRGLHVGWEMDDGAWEAAIDEALKCKETKEEKVIVFNCSGHGHFDMSAFDDYFDGKLHDYEYPKEKIEAALEAVPKI